MIVKANPLSTLIFRIMARRRIKRAIRDHEFFQEVRIETRSGCNGRCDFCPVAVQHNTRPVKKMSIQCFRKIIDELDDMNFRGFLGLNLWNEPLLDNRLPDFLAYIQAKRFTPRPVRIVTNGLLLTFELGEKLFENGLTELVVNDYYRSWQVSLKIKRAVGHLQMEYPDRKIELVERSRDEVLDNRAGMSPNNPMLVSIKVGCTRPFRQLNIVANGNISFCCVDGYADNPLGNVNTSSLREIWKNEAFTSLRRDLLRNDRSPYKLCSICEHKGYVTSPEYTRLRDRITWFAADRLNRQIESARGRNEAQ